MLPYSISSFLGGGGGGGGGTIHCSDYSHVVQKQFPAVPISACSSLLKDILKNASVQIAIGY